MEKKGFSTPYNDAWNREHTLHKNEGITPSRLRTIVLQQRKLFGSYQQMGREIGTTGSALSQFVSGRKAGGMNHVRSDSKIVQALGIKPVTKEEYITGDGKPTFTRVYKLDVEL